MPLSKFGEVVVASVFVSLDLSYMIAITVARMYTVVVAFPIQMFSVETGCPHVPSTVQYLPTPMCPP